MQNMENMKIAGPIVLLLIIPENSTTIFGNSEKDYLRCDQAGRSFVSSDYVNEITEKFPATKISNPVEIPFGFLCALFPAESLLSIIE